MKIIYISDLRSKCKNQSDHDYLDSMESIIKEFEKPRKKPDYLEELKMYASPKFKEDWDKMLKEYLDQPE